MLVVYSAECETSNKGGTSVRRDNPAEWTRIKKVVELCYSPEEAQRVIRQLDHFHTLMRAEEAEVLATEKHLAESRAKLQRLAKEEGELYQQLLVLMRKAVDTQLVENNRPAIDHTAHPFQEILSMLVPKQKPTSDPPNGNDSEV